MDAWARNALKPVRRIELQDPQCCQITLRNGCIARLTEFHMWPMKLPQLLTSMCLLSLCGCASTQRSPQTLVEYGSSKWPSVGFSRVAAFSYDCEAENVREIVVNGRLNKSASPQAGVSLSDNQVEQLLYSVRTTFSGHRRTYCFNPRNGFVFYNARNRIVAYLSVCFECGTYSASPAGTSSTWNLDQLRSIFSELGIKTDLRATAER